MTSARTVATMAALTLREASRRRVLLALAALTVVLLALSGWGFSRLAAESGGSAMTSGEARLTASILLNLVMFGFSLIAALGTAFLAGPTLAGETESGIALAVLAQRLVVWATVDYWPPDPAAALALLAAQTTVLLTLAVLLSTAVSPMASGVVAVGLFGATWVAGVVGAIGASLDNDSVARVGTVSRVLLPTDGLWRGAMHAFQDPSALIQFGGQDAEAFPFLSPAPLTAVYLAWVAVWVAIVFGSRRRRSFGRTFEWRWVELPLVGRHGGWAVSHRGTRWPDAHTPETGGSRKGRYTTPNQPRPARARP